MTLLVPLSLRLLLSLGAPPALADTCAMTTVLPIADTHPGSCVGSSLAGNDNVMLAAADYAIGDFIKSPSMYGQVYEYRRHEGAWHWAGALPRPSSESLRFGYSLDFDGVRAIVGSLTDAARPHDFSGTAHVYIRKPEGWTLEEAITDESMRGLGWAVSIDGDTAAVSTRDSPRPAVVIFRHVNGKWSREQELGIPRAGAAGFGQAIDIRGNTLAVSAREESEGAGAVYLFRRQKDTWREESRIAAAEPQKDDWFGHSLSLGDDVLIVGAPQCNNRQGSGRVLAFRRTEGEWQAHGELVAPDAMPLDWFGTSVSLSNDKVAIGAYGDDGPNGPTDKESGSCYLFQYSQTGWHLLRKFVASKPAEITSFGHRVLLADNWLFVASQDTCVGSSDPAIDNRVKAGRIFAQPVDLADNKNP